MIIFDHNLICTRCISINSIDERYSISACDGETLEEFLEEYTDQQTFLALQSAHAVRNMQTIEGVLKTGGLIQGCHFHFSDIIDCKNGEQLSLFIHRIKQRE